MRDYFVYEHPETGEVGGACSLHICWEDLAEIRSLCVVEHLRRLGVGAGLVRACMEEATRLALQKLFVLTYRREFFRRFGFTEVEKTQLPQKIWTDCVKCPKFPLCDEVAMITRLP
jgi:amino-acid N-acetyltransferase